MPGDIDLIIRRAFPHLMGALPQLRSFSGVGGTLYAIVSPSDGEALLLGPALSAAGVAAWPAAARAAALMYFQKRRRAGGIAVHLVVRSGDAWHCAAVHLPPAEKACDGAVPLACANAVLGW